MGLGRGSPSAKGFELVTQTNFWNVWSTPAFRAQYIAQFDTSRLTWLDACYRQVIQDLGIQFAPGRGRSYDATHLDIVLDPASQGGAHTGTVFGAHGVSLSPDALYNVGFGTPGFWWFVLMMHETVNVITGSIAQGWVWADGSSMWAGQSPFPNMCDIIIPAELGRDEIARAQLSRMSSDPGVGLFLSIQRSNGWVPFRRLFQWTREQNIVDWHRFREPSLRTALLVWFLDRAIGPQAMGAPLLDRFNAALGRISGEKITDRDYSEAQALFPHLSH
jgi:hypothetical protein